MKYCLLILFIQKNDHESFQLVILTHSLVLPVVVVGPRRGSPSLRVVVVVPYFEWLAQRDGDARQAYLRAKLAVGKR